MDFNGTTPPPVEDKEVAAFWDIGYSNNLNFEVLATLQYGNSGSNETVLSLGWANADTLHIDVNQRWYAQPVTSESQTSINWFNKMPTIMYEYVQKWSTGAIEQFETIQIWREASQHETALRIHYGPSERAYICYRVKHPQKGRVIVRFDNALNASPQIGKVKLRMSPYEKICYWGLPGGPVRSDDDIPPIDSKIPIEPQIQRYYIMQPSISCNRLSDDLKILINSINITWQRGQFAATGNIKFCSRIDMERAIGQQLKLVINGYEFVVICEQPSTSNRFANNSYSASIRSRFAELAAPYQRERNYVNTVDKSLAGIMTDILENTGWTLDNKMIDYPIPEGAFSYRGLTPAAALLKVASSIGAILDINDTTKTVSVVPEWPVNPWSTEQATPDVILNDALILEHNTRDTIQPEHNVIFVRGEQQGVACKIKRQGTPATDYARDIVDNLITDVQAARQRGTCELARSGNKRTATIRTKLKADLPPIRPGMLLGVRFEDELYKATVDSLAIAASISNQGAIMVNQTIQAVRNV
ncbi:hypothetical protein L1D50_21750 [Pseudoalteromonas sp. Isolate6]|uniref:hypothetical protein n=1 Tax=Pseudoalteromonas sp. Isolate6 TaxID=2908527 RepID=UPI001EFCE561|nr:hypothetical protein [Pseudoalteromonas sp. Isolate6]MCG9761694.1 hypothetical protein [Pseudoalteromonas sp. Isolate6]